MKYSKFVLNAKIYNIYECFDILHKYSNDNLISNNNKFLKQENKIDELNEQLKQKSNEINNIYNSSSWRITKPIRKIIDMIRNIR